MSLENWNDILYACLRTNINKGITLIYLISCIFICNYVLLNLFLAVLLDGFDDDEINDDIAGLE